MDLKKKKYKIIEALLSVEEPKVLNDLEEILRFNSEEIKKNYALMDEAEDGIKSGRTYSLNEAKKIISDWNNEVSEIEKLFIKAGLKDIENGNTFTNEEVVREINEKYGL